MAGRGRGRGKANLSFDLGSLGFGVGDALPTQTLQPPSTYPTLQQRPTPLSSTKVDEYLLDLSLEYKGGMKDSAFYLKPNTVKKDIVRFTDRYKQTNQKADAQWEPDWRFFPEELKPSLKRKSTNRNVPVSSKALKKKKEVIIKEKEKEDVVKKLDELVQKEISAEQGNPVGDEGENEGEVELEEEEYEDEYDDDNDYNFDYYDDGGDNYGDDDDGGEEGPVY